MSAGVVLDASVALKLILDEEFSDQAEALVNDTLKRGELLYVPPLALSEVTNALLQRVRRGVMPEVEAQRALADFLQLPLQEAQTADLYERSLTFALANQIRSAYDATYVVLAQLLDVPLWTADVNLINALGVVAPWVRRIGDYSLPATGGSTL
jgi:predicted nucleic acid-binding protein